MPPPGPGRRLAPAAADQDLPLSQARRHPPTGAYTPALFSAAPPHLMLPSISEKKCVQGPAPTPVPACSAVSAQACPAPLDKPLLTTRPPLAPHRSLQCSRSSKSSPTMHSSMIQGELAAAASCGARVGQGGSETKWGDCASRGMVDRRCVPARVGLAISRGRQNELRVSWEALV